MTLHGHWGNHFEPKDSAAWNHLSRILMDGNVIAPEDLKDLNARALELGKIDGKSGNYDDPDDTDFSDNVEKSETILLNCKAIDTGTLSTEQRKSIRDAMNLIRDSYVDGFDS